MTKSPSLRTGLLLSMLLASVSSASFAQTAPNAAKIADQDFGRLSQDGVGAFNDVHQARLALFEGKIDEAATFVTDARTSLALAKTNGPTFVKAETALNSPGQNAVKTPAVPGQATTPIFWIPIDAELALGETFVASPQKSAAVVVARKRLEKGDHAKSLEAIRLAQVDVNYTVAVAPLEQSTADVDKANNLIASHDYYGASEALRQAEGRVRYDEIDDIANVNGATTVSSAKAK